MKTEGELQHRVKALAPPVTLVLVAAIGIVSVWTPLTHPSIATRCFHFPTSSSFSPVARACRRDDLGHECACFGTRRTHRRSCSRSCSCSWAIPAWRSACGRTSFHRPSRSGKPPGRRKAWASRWSVRLFVIPSSRLHRNVLYVFRGKGESRRGVSLMTAYHPTAQQTWLRRVGWLVLIWAGSVLALGVCPRPFQSSDESRRLTV